MKWAYWIKRRLGEVMVKKMTGACGQRLPDIMMYMWKISLYITSMEEVLSAKRKAD